MKRSKKFCVDERREWGINYRSFKTPVRNRVVGKNKISMKFYNS